MTSVVFVVPAHGRLEKSRVCLRQLARTCHTLEEDGIHATAVVVADDENLDIAIECGFTIVQHRNRPLGRKWNAGYRRAGTMGADYVVPFGSDNWVDPILFLDSLPGPTEIRCSTQSAVVREDGQKIARLIITYAGGDGVRIFPAPLMRRMNWEPAEADRDRAIDTSIMRELTRILGGRPRVRYLDVHPYQIVDWKTPGDQLNTYQACSNFRRAPELDPWEELAPRYPSEALDEMRTVYRLPAEIPA